MLDTPEFAVDVVIKSSSKKAELGTIPWIANHCQYHQHAEGRRRYLMPVYGELPYDSMRGLPRILRP